jgi:hypothetical protein
MPWFQVGDQMHSAPVIRRITAIAPAAVGLWVVAGSWSSDFGTNGVIPDEDLPWLFPDAPELAKALVTARAWKRVKGAHKFIDDPVTHKIPTRESVDNAREKAAERQRRSRERKSSRRDSSVTDGVTHSAHHHPIPLNGSVVNQSDPSRTPVSHDLIETIITEISTATGTTVDAPWAARIARHILDGRPVANPARYIEATIRAETDPRTRFLPLSLPA